MSAFLPELKRVTCDLNRLNAHWALVGALACSVHAEPRTTKDIDIALAVSNDEETERIADVLIKEGYSDKQILTHLSPYQRLGIRISVPSTKPYSVPLDLLSSSSGIEGEIVQAAINIELLPSLFVPVACLGHLLAMKLLSQDNFDRLKDRTDLRMLIARAEPHDIEMAQQALELIEARGFSRGKSLSAEFQDFLSLAGKDPVPKL